MRIGNGTIAMTPFKVTPTRAEAHQISLKVGARSYLDCHVMQLPPTSHARLSLLSLLGRHLHKCETAAPRCAAAQKGKGSCPVVPMVLEGQRAGSPSAAWPAAMVPRATASARGTGAPTRPWKWRQRRSLKEACRTVLPAQRAGLGLTAPPTLPSPPPDLRG